MLLHSSNSFAASQSLLSFHANYVNVSRSNGTVNMNQKSRRTKLLACKVEKKRKIVEHICLIKAKRDISEEYENNMLDYLYTTQYQMRGILAVSLGRNSVSNDGNVENEEEEYSHGVYMRFQRKEDVSLFYENPFYLKVLKEHVLPHCHGMINIDFEAEVEDDMLPIFRKGEEFNYGVESIHLMAFDESASSWIVEEALASLEMLANEFPSLIVQCTHGTNLNISKDGYTHAEVTRFRSLEAFEIFMSSKEYKEVWRSKFEPICTKSLTVHYSVDPVGKELM